MDGNMGQEAKSRDKSLRTAKLAVFIAALALVITLVVFFGLSRNMTGLADALQTKDMRIDVLGERIERLEQKGHSSTANDQ